MSAGRSETDLYEPQTLGRRLANPLFRDACFLATLSGVVILCVLLGSVIASAVGHRPGRPWYDVVGGVRDLGVLLWSLLFKTQGLDAATSGFKVGVVSSLWLLALVAMFSVPVGIGAAVYLEEYAPAGRLKRVVQTNIANLAGVPSIVYGILGLALFVRAFGNKSLALGYSLWSGALTLSLLVLPVIVIATQEALRAVPNSLRYGAMALGSTKWQMVRDHVIPSALPGILTGVILSLSRAIGETAPLLMVMRADSLLDPPRSPSDDFAPLPVEIYNYAKFPSGQGYETVVAGGILILLLLLLSMNALAIVIRERYSRGVRG